MQTSIMLEIPKSDGSHFLHATSRTTKDRIVAGVCVGSLLLTALYLRTHLVIFVLRCSRESWGLLHNACGIAGSYQVHNANDTLLNLYFQNKCHTVDQIIDSVDIQTCLDYVNVNEQKEAVLCVRKSVIPVSALAAAIYFGDVQQLLSLIMVVWFVKNV